MSELVAKLGPEVPSYISSMLFFIRQEQTALQISLANPTYDVTANVIIYITDVVLGHNYCHLLFLPDPLCSDIRAQSDNL